MKKLIFALALIFVGGMTFAANSQQLSVGAWNSQTVISENSQLTPNISGNLAEATSAFEIGQEVEDEVKCTVELTFNSETGGVTVKITCEFVIQ